MSNSIDIFGSLKTLTSNNTVLGTRLKNVKDTVCPYSQNVIVVNSDDTVNVKQATTFGLSLLNIQDLNSMVNTLKQSDSMITISDLGTAQLGQIDVKMDDTLIQQWKISYSEVMNELRTRAIIADTTHSRDIGSNNRYFNNIYGKTMVCKNGNGDNTFTENQILLNWKAGAPALGDNYSHAIKTRHREASNSGNAIDFYLWQTIDDKNAVGTKQVVSMTGTGVGISTSTPSTALDVNGTTTIRPSTTATGAIKVKMPTGTNGDSTWVGFSGDGSDGSDRARVGCLLSSDGTGNLTFTTGGTNTQVERMRITKDGCTQIGGASNLTESLMITGGNIGINSSSDTAGIAKLVFYHNPWVAGTPSWNTGKTAIITEAITDYGKSKLHFCLNNSTSSFTAQVSTADARMTIIPSGNVGIATTTPKYNLHIVSNSASSGFTNTSDSFGMMITGTTHSRLMMESTSSTTGSKMAVLNNTAGSLNIGSLNDTGGAWNKEKIISVNLADYSTTFGGNIFPDATNNYRNLGADGQSFNNVCAFNFRSKDNPMTFSAGNPTVSERMRISNTSADITMTANLLFSADNTYSVGSSTNALANVYAYNGNFKSIGSSANPTSNIYAKIWQTTSTENLRCGNNLILSGLETLPTVPLYDLSCGSTILMDSTSYIIGSKQTYDATNSELVISTTSSNTERVRIGANGLKTSVNILPTDSNRTLGSSSAPFNALYSTYLINPSSTSSLILGSQSTSTVCINTTGMSIGSGVAPTEALNVLGNIKVSGNILPNVSNVPNIGSSNTVKFNSGWFSTVYSNGVALTSDRRLKENIKPITNGLETVLKMQPVEYKMKDGIRIHTGFVADTMERLYNGEDWACFVRDKDDFGTQSLQYTECVALLASAIQELNEKVDNQLPNEVQQTKPQFHRCVEISRVNELYDRLSVLESENNDKSIELDSLKSVNSELSSKVIELTNSINNLPKKVESKIEIEDSDTGGLSMIESLQERLYKSEQLIAKQDKMIKKLTSAVNKLLKQAE